MLTRRGRAVAVVAAVATLLAALFGARSLNAVVAPAAVALAAGYVQVATTPDVAVERSPPGDAHVGERRTAELSVVRPDEGTLRRSFLGSVTEQVAEGLRPIPDGDATVADSAGGDAELTFETAVGAAPLSYDLRYERRGRHTLGPATVTATDAFGLFERDTALRGTTETLVYPRVRRLGPVGRRSLGRLAASGRSDRRGEFAALREYVPGDPLRNVHWKTTAKRDELVVTEFDAETAAESVTVAAGANAAGADAMAAATASVVLSLVDHGVPVELSLPRSELTVGPEYGGERALLRTLAVVGSGPVPDQDADVVIKGEAADASVDVRGMHHSFAEMVATGSADANVDADREPPEVDA